MTARVRARTPPHPPGGCSKAPPGWGQVRVRAHARRRREINVSFGILAKIHQRPGRKADRPAPPAPGPATILRHCRCVDCRRWNNRRGYCREFLFRRYVPREEYPKAMRPFWTDVGRIRPEQWHYCARYDGPALSADVWVWPKRMAARERTDA